MVHPAKDYPDFENFVEGIIEDLFVGFRLHKAQHIWRSTGKRPDFTLLREDNPRERLVVDAKFYSGTLGKGEVRSMQKHKGHPFMARHAALVFPQNCFVSDRVIELAEETGVVLVRFPVWKRKRFKWTLAKGFLPWPRHAGFKVDAGFMSHDEIVSGAEWWVGPTW